MNRILQSIKARGRWPWLGSLAVLLLLYGCYVPSLHGLYTPETLVQPKGLAGKWRPLKTKEVWEFEVMPDNQFKLTLKNKKKVEADFKAWVVQLGPHQFLDLLPNHITPLQPGISEDQAARNSTSMLRWNIFPVHTFSRLTLRGDTLALATFFPSYLDTLQLRTSADYLPHVKTEAGLLITAETPELQKFLKAHALDKAIFKEDILLVREKEGGFLGIF